MCGLLAFGCSKKPDVNPAIQFFNHWAINEPIPNGTPADYADESQVKAEFDRLCGTFPQDSEEFLLMGKGGVAILDHYYQVAHNPNTSIADKMYARAQAGITAQDVAHKLRALP